MPSKKYLKKGMYGKKSEDGLTPSQRYYKRHREQRILENKQYQSKNREKVNAKMREYRKNNPDIFKALESKRKRPAEQLKKFNEYRNRYRKENPDKTLAYYQKHRAKKGNVSGKELKEKRDAQNGICYYCDNKLDNNGRGHTEHKTPLSRGGEHEIDNIVFACSKCNLKKATKTEYEFKNFSR